MPEKRKKCLHSPTSVGSGNGKRPRLGKPSDNDKGSGDSGPSSGGEDSEIFSEYHPTTDSGHSSDEYNNTRNSINYRGLLIKKGEFVFVKNESPEDWIARVERVCGTKRKLYVRWMREDGQEIVMDDEFDWLSVDTIQDLVRPRPRVNSSSIGERWMRQIATNPASLAPVRDEHAPLQTGSAENRKLESTEPIFRLTSSSACEIAGTAWYWLENLEGDAQPVPGLTTKIKLAPLQLRAPRRWNLPPLWEVLGCYRHHPLR